MGNELMVRPIEQHKSLSIAEAKDVGQLMFTSGMFPDVKSAAMAVVKILAGQELGFGPFASMSGISIVAGKAEPGANMLATMVKRSGRYDYRVVRLENDGCEIAYFEGGKEIGRSKFTLDDAKRAGTKNLDKFPRNMLFARAMTNGIKWHCPDVENGVAVYAQGEINGECAPSAALPEPPPAVQPQPEPAPPPAAQPDRVFGAQLERMEALADSLGVSWDAVSRRCHEMFGVLTPEAMTFDQAEEILAKMSAAVAAKQAKEGAAS